MSRRGFCAAEIDARLGSQDRPQSARELLSKVHRCYAKFSAEARLRRKRFIVAAAGAMAVAVATVLGAWAYQHVQASAELERSIAVLPFENLSANGEDTYFTVGMQEEDHRRYRQSLPE